MVYNMTFNYNYSVKNHRLRFTDISNINSYLTGFSVGDWEQKDSGYNYSNDNFGVTLTVSGVIILRAE